MTAAAAAAHAVALQNIVTPAVAACQTGAHPDAVAPAAALAVALAAVALYCVLGDGRSLGCVQGDGGLWG